MAHIYLDSLHARQPACNPRAVHKCFASPSNTMLAPPASLNTSQDTDSISSKESAAIVSLYNNWSSSTQNNDEDGIQSLDGICPGSLSKDELLSNLRKRCREQDIPKAPPSRPKNRGPTCSFLNYMGSIRLPPPPPAVADRPPAAIGLDFGFEEELVDLFPLCSKKARHEKGDTVSVTDSEFSS